MRKSARRTILIALMAGGALVGTAAVPLRTIQPDGSGDDDGQAPAGGSRPARVALRTTSSSCCR